MIKLNLRREMANKTGDMEYKVDNYCIEIKNFGNSEKQYTNIDTLLKKILDEKDVVEYFDGKILSVDLEFTYLNDADIFELYMVSNMLNKKLSANNITFNLIMLYVPYSRMDHVSKNGIAEIKYFAELINSLNFDNVFILDPHSDVISALIKNVTVISPFAFGRLHRLIDDVDVVCFPDGGAYKKYINQMPSSCANKCIYAVKHRNSDTNAIDHYNLITNGIDLTGKNIIIIDDICSYGNTFIRCAEALKEAGAKSIKLWVSHCETNIHNGDIFKTNLIDFVYTTNSMPDYEGEYDSDSDKISRLDIFQLFSNRLD